MSYQVYSVALPEHPQAVTFIQGIVGRNFSGLLWMWRHVSWIRRSNETAEGCIQVKAGICGKNEVMLVSYWKNQVSLATFFKSEPHQKMMAYLSEHPTNLTLYNETYCPSRSGKYVNEPNGLAMVYDQHIRATEHSSAARAT